MNETDEHRANEDRIARDYAARFGVVQFKIGGGFARIDRGFMAPIDGVISAFAEIKCQNTYRFGQFNGGYKLHDQKVYAAKAMYFATNCPVWLIVEFFDCLAQLDLVNTIYESGHKIFDRRRNEWQEAVQFGWSPFQIISRRATPEKTGSNLTSAAEQ